MTRAPFSYHGGKSAISPLIWQCLGDPRFYVEPFGGTLANLLARPATSHRIVNEAVGDADCLIIHFWRAIRNDPAAVAWYAIGPVANTELQARHAWLVSQRNNVLEQLSDPNWFDPKIAGWWAWGQNLIVSGDWCGRWPKLTPVFALEATNRNPVFFIAAVEPTPICNLVRYCQTVDGIKVVFPSGAT